MNPQPSKKHKILICDDEEGVRESFRLILEDDYDLDFVNNGREAVEYFKRERADLLILDMKMPRASGLEALREIRQFHKTLPVIIATAYQSSEVGIETARLGCIEYLIKPFDRRSVTKAVTGALAPAASPPRQRS